MRQQRIFFLLFTAIIFTMSFLNPNFTSAGWETDTVGDASKTYLDITNMTISKTNLQIELNENPYYNDSGEINWRFYNIWIDTSMGDDNPNTTIWSTDMYEYVAHFDCRWNGSHWLNNSYINAFRYYLTSDGSEKVLGSFWWDGNNWVGSDPNIDIAVISGNNIAFEIDGAIHREQPLGTGFVIQGVANTSNGTTVDIAPNHGWVDEFDNMCEAPEEEEEEETETTPFSSLGFLLGFVLLGIIGSSIGNIKKWKK